MSTRVYAIDIPLEGGANWLRLVESERPEVIAEVVRVLLTCETNRPSELRVLSNQKDS